MKNKYVISLILLAVLILLENLFLYYFHNCTNNILSQDVNSTCLVFSSVLFGIILIYRFYNAEINEKNEQKKHNLLSYIMLAIFFVGIAFIAHIYNNIFHQIPIDPRNSDIIPEISVMCKRFLAGEYPYTIITNFGYPLTACYLPMHWLPFSIAQLLHIDYRWIPFVAWWLVAILLCVRTMKNGNIMIKIFVPLFILWSNFFLIQGNNDIIASTVELLISAYYMIFIIGLNYKNGIFQGLFISLCLLSRYSILLWIPLYIFILYVSNNKKILLKSTITIPITILFVLVIPFLSKDWTILLEGYKYYNHAAIHEWTSISPNGLPNHFRNGCGFAYVIYTNFKNLDILYRIKIAQTLHLYVSLIVPIILGIWYWFKKDKIDYKIFLMASFKIYMSFFLFFIQVPYLYLMMVGNFVTLAIFCEQLRYEIKYNIK